MRGATQPSVRAHGVPAASSYLPEGKSCAVCFTIDDVHPGRSTDAYEAGGDRERGALRHVQWLLDRHPELAVTLFVTPDWREISPFPTRKLLAALPLVGKHLYQAPILPRGTMRLDRHPEFTAYLRSLPRTQLALHGLHHVHRGPRLPVEFQDESRSECATILREAMGLFRQADLTLSPGLQPPAWNLTPMLAEAVADVGLTYVAAARDVVTDVEPGATTNMSGPRGLSLTSPTLIAGGRVVHFTSNFQATSPPDRALAILEVDGVLAIKAHIVKSVGAYVALDGLDELYRNYLDLLLSRIEDQFGERVWFTSMEAIADRVLGRAGG